MNLRKKGHPQPRIREKEAGRAIAFLLRSEPGRIEWVTGIFFLFFSAGDAQCAV